MTWTKKEEKNKDTLHSGRGRGKKIVTFLLL